MTLLIVDLYVKAIEYVQKFMSEPGTDPGFLEGVKINKRGSFWYFYLNFHKHPHENEIILIKSGV